jgi:WD40 repeat protein
LLARAAEQAADPWSKAVPAAVAELAARATPRALLPTAVLAGCALAGLVGWAVASGGPKLAEPAPATPVGAAAPVPAANPVAADPLPAGATARFGSPRYRHTATIEGLAVSADGAFAVAHSGTRFHGAVRAYDLATGRVLLTVEQEPGGGFVEGVAVSPDGRTLAIKGNHSVFLYDATTGKETGRVAYPAANPSTTTDLLAFAPDGRHVVVAAAEGKAVHLIGLARGEVLRTFPHAHVVFAAAFSPDGRNIVAGGYDSENNVYFARLWDAETGKELHRLPFGNGGIRCVAYSPDGKTVAVGGDGGKTLAVKLFDAATGKETLKIPFLEAPSVKSVAFSPDGKTLAASGGFSTRLFEAATGKETLKIDRKAIGLRFAPDGKTLVGAVAGTVYRWDAATGKSLIPAGGDSPVAQVEVTADGKRVVTRGQDGDAHVWDARTGEHLRRVDVSWQRGLALSPDGRFLVWPVADEKIKFKDPNQPNMTYTGSRLRMFDTTEGKFVERFGGFEGDAHDLFFATDGKTLVTVDHRDASVRVWDAATGKVERSFRAGDKGAGGHVAWRSRLSPDGKVLAVAYQPAGRGFFSRFAVKLWDTATGKELHDLPGHWSYVQALAFSADGKSLVSAGEALAPFAQQQLKVPAGQVFVWEVAVGKLVAQPPTGGTAAAFAPDGKALAVADADGTITFRDTATWAVKSEFRGPRERVTTLTFGPDGRLYSGAVDATVLAWDVGAAKPPAKEP